jgi:hypothetical protein
MVHAILGVRVDEIARRTAGFPGSHGPESDYGGHGLKKGEGAARQALDRAKPGTMPGTEMLRGRCSSSVASAVFIDTAPAIDVSVDGWPRFHAIEKCFRETCVWIGFALVLSF